MLKNRHSSFTSPTWVSKRSATLVMLNRSFMDFRTE